MQKKTIHSPEELPSCLRTRAGWVEWLESRRPSEPHVHQIEPTNHCPYHCMMCPRPNKMSRALGFMDLALYRKIIDEIATFSEPVRSKEIELFHFGESLLHPQLPDMVAHSAKHGLRMTLSVNPPHLTDKRAEALLAAQPYKVIVSMDGYDPKSYQMIRGKVALFDRAVSNMEKLQKRLETGDIATQVVVRIIEMAANTTHIAKMRSFWEEKGFAVEVRQFFPWSEKELITLGEYECLPPLMPCAYPWQYLVVQWDGTVVPCCRDYNAENVMGNVREQPLREIWNSPTYAAFRKQHETGDYHNNRICAECMGIYYNPGHRQ